MQIKNGVLVLSTEIMVPGLIETLPVCKSTSKSVYSNLETFASIPSALTFFSVSFTIRVGFKSEGLGINLILSAFREGNSTDRGMSSHFGRLVVRFRDSYRFLLEFYLNL